MRHFVSSSPAARLGPQFLPLFMEVSWQGVPRSPCRDVASVLWCFCQPQIWGSPNSVAIWLRAGRHKSVCNCVWRKVALRRGTKSMVLARAAAARTARLGAARARPLHLHALQTECEAAGAEPRPPTSPRRRRTASGTHGMHENRRSRRAPAANTRRRRRRPSPTPSARRRKLTAKRATGSPPRETPAASNALTARPRRSTENQKGRQEGRRRGHRRALGHGQEDGQATNEGPLLPS